MSIGNKKDSGNKGSNFPWQLSVLKGLQSISNNTDIVESLLTQLVSIAQTSSDYESAFVIDAIGIKWLEVRVYNTDTATWNPPIYFLPESNVTGTPTSPVVYDTNLDVGMVIIPEVATVPITTWNASVGFTSDPIPFIGNKAWCLQIAPYAILSGTPVLKIEISIDGVNYSSLKSITAAIDMTDRDQNSFFYEDTSMFNYMRFVYTPAGSTGTFSLILNK